MTSAKRNSNQYGNSRLLQRVCYVSRPERKMNDLSGTSIDVRPTFAYNPASKTTPETAQRWVNCDYRYNPAKNASPVDEHENTEFQVKIVDLDVRGEGGRAYQVVDDNGRLFDLREDQMLDVLRLHGIDIGGRIRGQFVWGQLGSQMRMVLVGGVLHTEMIKNGIAEIEAQRAAKIMTKPGNLRPGDVIEKSDNTRLMYLGRARVGENQGTLSFVWAPLPRPPVLIPGFKPRGNDQWEVQRSKEQQVAQTWHTMSWKERLQWEWHERYQSYHARGETQSHPNMIITYALPRGSIQIDIESAERQTELQSIAAEIRANADGRHGYQNGNGDDITKPDYGSAANVHFRPFDLSQSMRRGLSPERQRQAREAAIAKFRDELIWD